MSSVPADMTRAFPTPEAAALADSGVPSNLARVVAVDHAPSGRHAVVFIEFNEPPHVEQYEVLCERTDLGWAEGHGSSGGWNWTWTHDDPERGPLGVHTRWNPPKAEWDVSASGT